METDGSESPTAGIQKKTKKLRPKYIQGVISKITKTNFTKINSRRIIYRKLRIRHVIPEKNYAK